MFGKVEGLVLAAHFHRKGQDSQQKQALSISRYNALRKFAAFVAILLSIVLKMCLARAEVDDLSVRHVWTISIQMAKWNEVSSSTFCGGVRAYSSRPTFVCYPTFTRQTKSRHIPAARSTLQTRF